MSSHSVITLRLRHTLTSTRKAKPQASEIPQERQQVLKSAMATQYVVPENDTAKVISGHTRLKVCKSVAVGATPVVPTTWHKHLHRPHKISINYAKSCRLWSSKSFRVVKRACGT